MVYGHTLENQWVVFFGEAGLLVDQGHDHEWYQERYCEYHHRQFIPAGKLLGAVLCSIKYRHLYISTQALSLGF